MTTKTEVNTAIVATCDGIAERALRSELVGVVTITIDMKGHLQLCNVGISTLEAMGALDMMHTVLLRKGGSSLEA